MAVDTMYAMRRANGDWFALDQHDRLRVPIFGCHRDGMLARADNWGMSLFKPVALDGRSLKELVPADGVGEAELWLVESPFTNLKRGRPVDRAQLSQLLRDAAQGIRG